jgi:hypothetical protein
MPVITPVTATVIIITLATSDNVTQIETIWLFTLAKMSEVSPHNNTSIGDDIS